MQVLAAESRFSRTARAPSGVYPAHAPVGARPSVVSGWHGQASPGRFLGRAAAPQVMRGR